MRCTDDFADCTQAIDGASELFYELYDDAGLAARMAIGAVHVIGDAKKVGNLCGAILAANKLVISL